MTEGPPLAPSLNTLLPCPLHAHARRAVTHRPRHAARRHGLLIHSALQLLQAGVAGGQVGAQPVHEAQRAQHARHGRQLARAARQQRALDLIQLGLGRCSPSTQAGAALLMLQLLLTAAAAALLTCSCQY